MIQTKPDFSLFAILLVVAIVALLIYGIRRRPVAGIALTLIGLFFAAFFFSHKSLTLHTGPHPMLSITAPSSLPMVPALPTPPSIGTIHADEELYEVIRVAERQQTPVAWKPEVNELFLADLYGTKQSAVEATGQHTRALIETLFDICTEDAKCNEQNSILVHAAAHHVVDSKLLNEIREQIENALPGATVRVHRGDFVKPGQSSAPQIKNKCEYRVAVRPNKHTENGRDAGGLIELTVNAKSGSATHTLRYAKDSSWAFQDVSPNHLRIRTPEFCHTRQDAEQHVLGQAAKHLAMLATRLPVHWPQSTDLEQKIREHTEKVVSKRFTQQLTNKRNETFYRSALELNLHDAVVMLHSLAAEQNPNKFASQTQVRTVFHSMPIRGTLGLLASVLGISTVLKRVTRSVNE